MPEQLADRVMIALAGVKHISPERISLDSSLDDLGFDSLDKVTLLFELEKQLQISIPDEELRSIRSVGDVVAGISRLMANGTMDATALGENP